MTCKSFVQQEPNAVKPRDMSQKPLNITSVPGEGDTVTVYSVNGKKSVKLLKRIGSGGEGAVYDIGDELVCKIYAPEKLTTNRAEKILWMCRRESPSKGLCWPESIVLDGAGLFIGYTMKKAKGVSLFNLIASPEDLTAIHPTWKRSNLYGLAASVAKIVSELHKRDVFIGDINDNNIIISDEGRVFFVDTDSFQFEDFPSPVGTPEFLSARLQEQDLSKTLRTKEDELFSLAVMIFMILMFHQGPFACRNGASPEENILNGNFPYGGNGKKETGVPFGPWKKMYQNMTGLLKKTFNDCFTKGTFATADKWYQLLSSAKYASEKNFVSNELVPTGYKTPRPEDAVELKCSMCEKRFKMKKEMWQKLETRGLQPICDFCYEEEAYICEECGEIFTLHHYEAEKLARKGARFLCPRCRSRLAQSA